MHGANSPGIKFLAIGLMSGTSMDAIDAAILVSDGVDIFKHGPVHERVFLPNERAIISKAMDAAAALAPGEKWPGSIAAADALITQTHIEAVRGLLDIAGISPQDVDIVGFHGQTLVHRPDLRFTLQVGSGADLSIALGIAVIDRFRLADIAAGGQGAPLAPVYHQALLRGAKKPGCTSAVINLGGVGNITFIDEGCELLAFDTGPGNALLDDWVVEQSGANMDKDGELALAGRVNAQVLSHLMDNTYLRQKPPKSLDRNDFSLSPLAGLSLRDGAATLCAFTALCIRAAIPHLPKTPQRWIICGGGRHNPALMRELAARLPGAVCSAEHMGWRGDALEVEAFAFLAIRSFLGMPLSFSGTTGVPEPMPGGVLHNPQ